MNHHPPADSVMGLVDALARLFVGCVMALWGVDFFFLFPSETILQMAREYIFNPSPSLWREMLELTSVYIGGVLGSIALLNFWARTSAQRSQDEGRLRAPIGKQPNGGLAMPRSAADQTSCGCKVSTT